MLAFSELFQWNSASDFIADHLNYELLEPAHELVSTKKLNAHSQWEFLLSRKLFWSPTKTLADQRGNSFDYANLLCSLLDWRWIWCLRGQWIRHTREVCYMDTTRLPNPYVKKTKSSTIEFGDSIRFLFVFIEWMHFRILVEQAKSSELKNIPSNHRKI